MPEWYSGIAYASDSDTIRIDPPEPSTAWVVTEMPDTRVEGQVMETPLNEACMTTDVGDDDHIVYYSMDEFNYVMADTPEVHRTVKQLLEEKDWEL
jgi:hypothetical protein